MHASVGSIQGVLRIAHEFVIDICLPPEVHAKISRRKVGRSHLEVHRVVLVKRSGSCPGNLPSLLKTVCVEGRNVKAGERFELRRSCIVLLLAVGEEVDGSFQQVRLGPM